MNRTTAAKISSSGRTVSAISLESFLRSGVLKVALMKLLVKSMPRCSQMISCLPRMNQLRLLSSASLGSILRRLWSAWGRLPTWQSLSNSILSSASKGSSSWVETITVCSLSAALHLLCKQRPFVCVSKGVDSEFPSNKDFIF